jgi:hypothetical protein
LVDVELVGLDLSLVSDLGGGLNGDVALLQFLALLNQETALAPTAALALAALAATTAAALGSLDTFVDLLDVGVEDVGAAEVDGVDSAVAELSYGVTGIAIVDLCNDRCTKLGS